jgi:hypothetical protein
MKKQQRWPLALASILVAALLSSCGGGGRSPAWQTQAINLTLSSISPTSGRILGGTTIVLKGGAFKTGIKVSFGGTESTAVSFTNSTQIQAVTPAHAPGKVDVTVTNPDPDTKTATLAGAFTYLPPPTVTSVSPSSGPSAGGTAVTITGSDFQQNATVAFGGVEATPVTVASATQIQTHTPVHPSGTVDIVVTNPTDGQSDKLAGAFTYIALHTVSLAWDLSTSPNVTGYNIYRGAASGGPYSKVNISLIAGTTFDDTMVQGSRDYFYVATAVDSSSSESAYSNEVQAAVPP